MIRLRRPSWFAILLTLAGVLFFVRLGIWQLDRAAYKKVLLKRFAVAATAPVRDFSSLHGLVVPQSYPHLRAHGHFLPGRFYMLDDQDIAGRPGVEVYAPFKLDDDSRVLLVGLGFLPREGPRLLLPKIPPIKPGTDAITGIYAPPPAPGLKLGGNALARQKTWPKLTTYIDMQQIAGDLHVDLYPRVLLLDPDPSVAYLRVWKPGFIPPARHYGYAFQWFAFAFAAVAIFVILHRKTESGEDDE